jgi:hypothetical protein
MPMRFATFSASLKRKLRSMASSRWVTANPLRPVIWADDDPRIRRCRKWLRTLQPESLIVNPEKAIGLSSLLNTSRLRAPPGGAELISTPVLAR